MPYGVGGTSGGPVNPNAGGIRPPVGEGQRAGQTPAAGQKIADGALVEGLVTSKDGDAYTVKIGNQTLNARATIPLFVGQRFRAVWDASTTPPMLRLQQGDAAMLAKFSGKDQQVAMGLLARGLPVNDEVLWGLRQQWMRNGGDPKSLGALIELWARGIPASPENVNLMMWYMELLPANVLEIWKRIRERLHERKFRSPSELLAALKEGDPEAEKFLKAHSLAGRPAKSGVDAPLMLAPTWWPTGERGDAPTLARVAVSTGQQGERKVWSVAFEMDCQALGPVAGEAITNGRALSINLRTETRTMADYVRNYLGELEEDLKEIRLPTQHLGVGVARQDAPDPSGGHSVDMEA